MDKSLIEGLLPEVSKPSRYLGNEWNSIHKDWDSTWVKMGFAFPDVYEVAMSHLGLQILYGLVNQHSDYLMERIFAPWVDMEQLMRRHGLGLFSLESYRPARDFDIIGFTLQYEMSFTNLLNMLELSAIPFKVEERDSSFPLIIAGGPCSMNPEPLSEFVDCFVLGDAEEVLPEILALIKNLKREPDQRVEKRELKQALLGIESVYIPEFYRVSYHAAGTIKEVTPLEPAVPPSVKRRAVRHLETVFFPTAPIVPYMDVVHERAMLEVLRGCTRGCRFCQAGMIYRPVRERNPETLLQQADELIRHTGYDEISLTSLSTADYSCVEQVLHSLIETHGQQGVGISLPSLRVDSFSVKLAEEIQKVRKSTLTFAPEAGTQRLRDVINKGVTEQDLIEAVSGVFKAGWTGIKLYFMLGLPTESWEDLEGIARLAKAVRDLGIELASTKEQRRKIKVTVSVSSFVPKSHTPFQWEPQDSIKVLREKQQFLKGRLTGKALVYNYHEAETSFLEAVFARGDRRLGQVLLEAHQRGCKFDSWNEFFNFQVWMQAFDACGIDPGFYASRQIPYEETLPWDHLDPGVSKRYLQVEHTKAMREKTTSDCRGRDCSQGCSICHRFDLKMNLCGDQACNV